MKTTSDLVTAVNNLYDRALEFTRAIPRDDLVAGTVLTDVHITHIIALMSAVGVLLEAVKARVDAPDIQAKH